MSSNRTLLACKYIVENNFLASKYTSCETYDWERRPALAKDKDSYAAEFARKGGKARAKKLTPERRREIARNAVQARWTKAKKKHKSE